MLTRKLMAAFLAALALCASCASNPTEQAPEALAPEVSIPVAGNDSLAAGLPSATAAASERRAAEGSVTSADEAGFTVTFESAPDLPALSSVEVRVGGALSIAYVIESESTFGFPGNYVLINGGSARMRLTGISPSVGDEVSVELIEENAYDTQAVADLVGGEEGFDHFTVHDGGSMRPSYLNSASEASDEIITEHGIQVVINFSSDTVTGSEYERLKSEGKVFEADYATPQAMREALRFMASNPGPYLVTAPDTDSRLELPVILSALMGARTSQITGAVAASWAGHYGFDPDGDQRAAIAADTAAYITALNGGSEPTDSQLLAMSANHLNTVYGMDFADIPTLRLALR